MLNNDTIVAVATPPGEGGIALIRLSGPESHAIAARLFRSAQTQNAPPFPGYSVRYGRFVDEATGETADDGLLTAFRAPHSYTGEDTVELSCHGGRATTARLLALAVRAGARLAEPGEFTQRAFLNGRLDLAQAEAVADVIRARTEGARRVARRQLEGNVSQAVSALREELIGILAAIEVTIDFSDEVGELEYAPLRSRIATVHVEVERLIASFEKGRVLREGLRVAIVGRPNAGKSSLLNALLRADRAIVTPVAGTTRDLVEESASFGGMALVLIDTAGLRITEDVVERIGVERAVHAAAQADVALLLLDATTTSPEDACLLATYGVTAPRTIAVLNKCDLLTAEQVQAHCARLQGEFAAVVAISAQTGAGLETLEAALLEAGGMAESGHDTAETVVVTSARHRQALETARTSLHEAQQTAMEELPGDFVAIDVRGALDALGQITGETVSDEIVHRIFRDFCVGK